MAYFRRIRGRAPSADYWPGFVDAMATLLLVLIFLLSIFMLTQFFQGQALTGKDSALNQLRSQVSELADLLALSRAEKSEMQTRIGALTQTLDTLEAKKKTLVETQGKGESDDRKRLKTELEKERRISAEALTQVEIVSQQLTILRRQLAALETALEAAETRDRESKTQIADLGRRLNSALARKVQELSLYRSDFFARLRDVLGNREGIEIVGDRFVFQSEIFFRSGSTLISPEGQNNLEKMARLLKEIARDIPADVQWVLRVDGHSDARPINTPALPTNWHLSAARAIAVVRFLVAQGVAEKRLVAAGFGEFQPLVEGQTPEAWRRNRRIEFKLTRR